MMNLNDLCLKYNLGNIKGIPQVVTGGLMHKMYHVCTDKGEYAIKVLNSDIMKRSEALNNMINSELVSNALSDRIPLIAAKSFGGNSIIEEDKSFFMVFDWLEGKSVFVPDISEYHCEKIGKILGIIHASHIDIGTMDISYDVRNVYDWKFLMEKAQEYHSEVYHVLQESISNIILWDKNAVCGLREASKNQVISHRDLDPKNVMWNDNEPYIIDWEAAGYVNPYQELIEVLNYWIQNEEGRYDKEKFIALMTAYTEKNDISSVNWEKILYCSLDGMLGWLEYNLKRALKMEGSNANDLEDGIQQTIGTISELKKYENQMGQLKDWIDEYVRNKYTI